MLVDAANKQHKHKHNTKTGLAGSKPLGQKNKRPKLQKDAANPGLDLSFSFQPFPYGCRAFIWIFAEVHFYFSLSPTFQQYPFFLPFLFLSFTPPKETFCSCPHQNLQPYTTGNQYSLPRYPAILSFLPYSSHHIPLTPVSTRTIKMASFGQDTAIRSKIHDDLDLCRLILTAASASSPLEIRESNIPNAGSGLFTSAPIPVGVEIFRSSPIVNVRDPSARHVCDWCYATTPSGIDSLGAMAAEQLGATSIMPPKPTAMLLCSGCKVGRYCSQACQRNAWKTFHKLECKAVLSEAPAMGPTTLAMYRLLLLKKDGRFTERQWKAIMQLESHFEEQNEDLRNDILAKVHGWGRRMGTDVDFMTVWELLCIVGYSTPRPFD